MKTFVYSIEKFAEKEDTVVLCVRQGDMPPTSREVVRCAFDKERACTSKGESLHIKRCRAFSLDANDVQKCARLDNAVVVAEVKQ